MRILNPETIQWLRRELQRGALSWAAPGRGLCERDQWRNRQGRLCAASARQSLLQLAAELCLAPLPGILPGPAEHQVDISDGRRNGRLPAPPAYRLR